MNFIYVCSSEFDYRLAINPDCGPNYAADLGVTAVSFLNCPWDQSDMAFVIDPRLSKKELSFISTLSSARPEVWLIFRIVDPYFPLNSAMNVSENHMAMLAFSLANRPRTAVLSAYQPADLTLLLRAAYGPERFFVSPYPYNISHELPIDGLRKKVVVISGNNFFGMYPLRSFARRKRLRDYRWWSMSQDMKHPGYPDKTGRPPQGLVGKDYLAYLSKFEMMLTCPGRFRFEYMKFREAAYAGCCPVGEPADTLPPSATQAILPLTMRNYRDDIRLLSCQASEQLRQRAADYREAMKASRSPELLRTDLTRWIQWVQSSQRIAS